MAATDPYAASRQPPAGLAPTTPPPAVEQDTQRLPGATEEFRESAASAPAKPAAAKPQAPAGDAAPETIGDFRLTQKLGEGGMGAVYKAFQISMDRTVALKLLARNLAGNQAFVERFYREARTMAKLDHPNIVRGYAVGDENGQHYVAMEFIDGMSMQKWMDKRGKLSVGDAVHVALCAAAALEHAHEQNLIHRDIKPDNILITSKGVVKVADLGLAKKTDEDLALTQSGTGFGTPFYMPLEQYRDAKHVDGRADIYALGVTLYYFLTGELPFKGESHAQVIEAKQRAKFPPARRFNPEIPERLDLMIDKMMQKDRAHRYQTCTDVIRDLDSLGVANQTLSFVTAPTAPAVRPAAAGATRPTLPMAKTKPTAPPLDDRPERELWLLRYVDEHGRHAKKQVSAGRLKQLIERNEIDVATATIMHPGEHAPRAISSVPEFAALVQSKVVKTKADRRSQKLESAYDKIERAQRRRALFRKIGNALRGLTNLFIILAVLAGLAIGGLLLFKNRDSLMQKIRETTSTPTPSSGP
jgi:serine/threonine-protein kinase